MSRIIVVYNKKGTMCLTYIWIKISSLTKLKRVVAEKNFRTSTSSSIKSIHLNHMRTRCSLIILHPSRIYFITIIRTIPLLLLSDRERKCWKSYLKVLALLPNRNGCIPICFLIHACVHVKRCIVRLFSASIDAVIQRNKIRVMVWWIKRTKEVMKSFCLFLRYTQT